MIKSVRNNKIDILRFLGIILIILAHCDAPLEINNFRCFDVILLVFISAYMYDENKCVNKNTYILYLKNKAKRLLKPTYFFIISFSLVLFIGYRLMGREELFGVKQMFNSLLLCEDSVGYVWIMKVYFINALLAPLFVYLQKKTKNSIYFFLQLIIQFVFYELIIYVYKSFFYDDSYIVWVIMHEWIICCMAYSFIAQISLWYKRDANWKKYGWIIWAALFIFTLIKYSNFCTVEGKRPANLHYLSWGLFVTEVLFKITPNIEVKPIKWISKNSLEIYFTHPFVLLMFTFFKNLFNISFNYFWLIEWIGVLGVSILFVIIKIKIQTLNRRKKMKDILYYYNLLRDEKGIVIKYLNNLGVFRYMSDEKFLKFYWKKITGKELDLDNPVTFNEKIQWLKLNKRNPEYTIMVDKLLAKDYVAKKIGKEHIIPTLDYWDDAKKIDITNLPEKFVLKCNHDSKDICICTDKKSFNLEESKKKLSKGLKNDFYRTFREWAYKDVPRRVLAEKYMVDESGDELKDYKVFNFNGEPKFIQVDYNRFKGHMRKIYDTEWNPMPFDCLYGNDGRVFEKPEVLEEVLQYAKILSEGFAFLRTDFYIINNKVYFGELTFYPEAGYGFISPKEWDVIIGNWINLNI